MREVTGHHFHSRFLSQISSFHWHLAGFIRLARWPVIGASAGFVASSLHSRYILGEQS